MLDGFVMTLTLGGGENWHADITNGNAAVTALLAGITGTTGPDPPGGWNSIVAPLLSPTSLARSSATVVTITLGAIPRYWIFADEVINVALPGSSLVSGSTLISTTSTITDAPCITSQEIWLTDNTYNLTDGVGTDYTANQVCSWKITLSGAAAIELTFEDQDTENHFDWTAISTGGFCSYVLGAAPNCGSVTEVASVTGPTVPAPIGVLVNEVFVRFYADGSIFGRGIYISFVAMAVGNFSQSTVIGASEAQVKAGGRTVVVSLSGAQFEPSVTTGNAGADPLIAVLASAATLGQAGGWDDVIGPAITNAMLVRDSSTQVTITLPAVPSYAPVVQETFGTVTIPASVLQNSNKGAVMDMSALTLGPAPPPNVACSNGPDNIVQFVNGEKGGLALTGNPYAANADCQWLIQAGNVTQITITFLEFDLEVTWDPLRIYDNATGTLLGTYDGNAIPGPLIFNTSGLLLNFKSDPSDQRAGFIAIFSTVLPTVSVETTPWTVDSNVVKGTGFQIKLTLPPPLRWVAAVTNGNATALTVIEGIKGSNSEANGWNTQLRPNLLNTHLMRASDSVVVINVPAQAGYSICAAETLNWYAPTSLYMNTAVPSNVFALDKDNIVTIAMAPNSNCDCHVFMNGTLATVSADESHIISGGLTIDIYITGDTFVAGVTSGNAGADAIIAALVGSSPETGAWASKVIATGFLNNTHVTRNSDTHITITLPYIIDYMLLSGSDTITFTLPSTAVTAGGGHPIQATVYPNGALVIADIVKVAIQSSPGLAPVISNTAQETRVHSHDVAEQGISIFASLAGDRFSPLLLTDTKLLHSCLSNMINSTTYITTILPTVSVSRASLTMRDGYHIFAITLPPWPLFKVLRDEFWALSLTTVCLDSTMTRAPSVSTTIVPANLVVVDTSQFAVITSSVGDTINDQSGNPFRIIEGKASTSNNYSIQLSQVPDASLTITLTSLHDIVVPQAQTIVIRPDTVMGGMPRVLTGLSAVYDRNVTGDRQDTIRATLSTNSLLWKYATLSDLSVTVLDADQATSTVAPDTLFIDTLGPPSMYSITISPIPNTFMNVSMIFDASLVSVEPRSIVLGIGRTNQVPMRIAVKASILPSNLTSLMTTIRHKVTADVVGWRTLVIPSVTVTIRKPPLSIPGRLVVHRAQVYPLKEDGSDENLFLFTVDISTLPNRVSSSIDESKYMYHIVTRVNDSTELSATPDMVYLLTSNATVPVPIKVTGVGDDRPDGDQYSHIVTSLYGAKAGAGAGSTSLYSLLDTYTSPPMLTIDDSRANVLITDPSPRYTTEDGNTSSIRIVLSAPPQSQRGVAITALTSNSLEAKVDPPSLTFTQTTWSLSQAFTVTGVDDHEIDGSIKFNISFELAADPVRDIAFHRQWQQRDSTFAELVNVDNEWKGTLSRNASLLDALYVSPLPEATGEDGSTSTLVLALASPIDQDMLVSVVDILPRMATASLSEVLFRAGDPNRIQVIQLTGIDIDEVAKGTQSYKVSLQADGPGDLSASIDMAHLDNDFSALNIIPWERLETSEVGTSILVNVSLGSQPERDVIVHAVSNDTSEGRVQPVRWLFSPRTWSHVQTFTVLGVRDDDPFDGDRPYVVEFYTDKSRQSNVSTSSLYSGVTRALPLINFNAVFPRIVRITPTIVPLNGTMLNITVSKDTFNNNAIIYVSGRSSPYPYHVLAHGSIQEQGHTGSAFHLSEAPSPISGTSNETTTLTIETPRLGRAAYLNLTIVDPTGGRTATHRLVFATDDCPTPGTFGIGVSCRPCPVCATCPGGNRVIPETGCWNSGEGSGFVVECVPKYRCRGGATPGDICSKGYSGEVCGQCDTNFYVDGLRCNECAGSSSLTATLILAVCIFFGSFTLVSVIATDKGLNNFTSALLALQLVRAVAASNSREFPKAVSAFYSGLNIVNLDIEFIQPECSVSSLSGFISVYITTLLLTTAAGVALAFVLFLTSLFMQTMSEKDRMITLVFWKNRMIRACLFLFPSLVYLNVTTRLIQAVSCSRVGSQLLLIADPTVVCYASTAHIVVAASAWILILLFSIGFPLGFVFVLWRKGDERYEPQFLARYGALYEGLKPGMYMFVMGRFAVALVIATARGALLSNAALATFVPIAGLSVYLLCLLVGRPFKVAWKIIVGSTVATLSIIGFLSGWIGSTSGEGDIDGTNSQGAVSGAGLYLSYSILVFGSGLLVFYAVLFTVSTYRHFRYPASKTDHNSLGAQGKYQHGKTDGASGKTDDEDSDGSSPSNEDYVLPFRQPSSNAESRRKGLAVDVETEVMDVSAFDAESMVSPRMPSLLASSIDSPVGVLHSRGRRNRRGRHSFGEQMDATYASMEEKYKAWDHSSNDVSSVASLSKVVIKPGYASSSLHSLPNSVSHDFENMEFGQSLEVIQEVSSSEEDNR